MSAFEFVFSLFGLLLGLSLAEVLGGFGRTLQRRRKLHVGWLTPLLGLVVMLDVASFWLVAWAVRDAIPLAYFPMLCGLLICGLYYLAATLAAPHELDEWPDLDLYYFEHRRLVIGGVLLCNALAIGALLTLGVNPLASGFTRATVTIFLGSAAAAMLLRGPRANAAILAFMALQYPVSSYLRLVGW
ncbi:MAG TPA: hypothetical protein VGW34_11300 [Allosphingosinicella sp.]|nr:hypothetical protein [Allosphingosinicella sp.]